MWVKTKDNSFKLTARYIVYGVLCLFKSNLRHVLLLEVNIRDNDFFETTTICTFALSLCAKK